MKAASANCEEAAVRQQCPVLHLPTVAVQFAGLALEAAREQHGYVRYLDALLAAELEEREVERSSAGSGKPVCRASKRWRTSTSSKPRRSQRYGCGSRPREATSSAPSR